MSIKTLTYGRRRSHLWATTLSPMGDDTLTYGRRRSHLWATTLSPIAPKSHVNTHFFDTRNQGSNQGSNQVCNQAIYQGKIFLKNFDR